MLCTVHFTWNMINYYVFTDLWTKKTRGSNGSKCIPVSENTSSILQIIIQSCCPLIMLHLLFSRLGPKKSYTQMKMTNKHLLYIIHVLKTTQVYCTKSMYKFCGFTNECTTSLHLCTVVDKIVNIVVPNYLYKLQKTPWWPIFF